MPSRDQGAIEVPTSETRITCHTIGAVMISHLLLLQTFF